MATKKKAKKKASTPKRKITGKAATKAAKKKAKKKTLPKRRAGSKRVSKATSSSKKRARTGSQTKSPKRAPTSSRRSARNIVGDSDSQGLSNVERADSESVAELVDEGNAFEAGAVSGVQEADDADEQEVRTREFPEDDVPEEYLDNDQ